MPQAQAGIFVEGSSSHFFLEFSLIEAVALDQLKSQLASAAALSVTAGVNVVWAFGADYWRKIRPAEVVNTLKPFTPIGKPPRQAPATQQDILLWVHGDNHSDNFDGAIAASRDIAVGKNRFCV
jgi:putative iron-dependent peroxidase